MKQFGGLQNTDIWRRIQEINKVREANNEEKYSLTLNTIGFACRGLDCHTNTLRVIAEALGLSLEQVLVSPDAKTEAEKKELLILDITRRVAREVYAPAPPPAPMPPAPTREETGNKAAEAHIAAKKQRAREKASKPRQVRKRK